jgi:hypothetical protein
MSRPAGAVSVSSKQKNLFLISTPLQFIFASMVARQVDGSSRFIVVTDYDRSLAQIGRIAELLSVPAYETIGPPTNHRSRMKSFIRAAFNYRTMLKLRSQVHPEDRVFMGYMNFPENRPFLFPPAGRRFEIAFFDEGTASIGILAARKAGQKAFVFPKAASMDFPTRFYPESIEIDRMHFYTVYPALSGGNDDHVCEVQPRLPPVRVSGRKPVREIWFVGSPVVQGNMIPAERMAEVIRELKRFASTMNVKLVYFPHRVEKLSELQEGLILREPGLPFELHYGFGGSEPLAVVSMISSAILNIRLFWGSEARVALIDPGSEFDERRIGPLLNYASQGLGIPLIQPDQLSALIAQ